MRQDEVHNRQEKELLGEYFETMVNHLPGGLVVIRMEKDGQMIPEFISEGFAAMTGMSREEAWRIYKQDALGGGHPNDVAGIASGLTEYFASGESQWELTYRLLTGNGDYIWVKNALTSVVNERGERRIYANYHDITKERQEQDRLRQQYNELILKHSLTPGAGELFAGHCNITQNRIIEILDHTKSNLLETFGYVRQDFFAGISGMIVDEEERRAFCDTFMNEPCLAAYERGETEITGEFYVKLPADDRGRYVRIRVKMVSSPDSGDIIGIMSVTDITEKVISELTMHKLSVASYDLVINVDLSRDYYYVQTGNREKPKIGRAHV